MSSITLYQALCLLGVPTMIGSLFAYCLKKFAEIKALKLGMQAVLRTLMINDYNKWSKVGYAPIYARDNFENTWKQYEALGDNGVMNDIHEKFLALPTRDEDEN